MSDSNSIEGNSNSDDTPVGTQVDSISIGISSSSTAMPKDISKVIGGNVKLAI